MLECLKIKEKKNLDSSGFFDFSVLTPLLHSMSFLLPSQRLSDSCSPHLAFQRLPQSFGEILIKSSLDYYIKASKLALPRAPSHIQARSNLPKIPLSWSPVFLEEPLINRSFMLRKHCKPVPHVPT